MSANCSICNLVCDDEKTCIKCVGKCSAVIHINCVPSKTRSKLEWMCDLCRLKKESQWKLINSLTDKRDKQLITCIQDSDGNSVEDPQQLANMFNEYFINAPLSLVAGLPDNAGVDASGSVYQKNSLFLYPVCEQ
ncbi:hypothetical protein J6590_067788 [Homalodisca vitripennis]|nr:hypothetical protein J6590_067788 [Homalodisca vitripennis]